MYQKDAEVVALWPEQERQPASNGLVFSNIMDETGIFIHIQCSVGTSEYITSLCMFAVVCDLQAGRAGLAIAEVLAAKLPPSSPSECPFHTSQQNALFTT